MNALLHHLRVRPDAVHANKPLAVIDIGSNTVRLVVFASVDDTRILFNEKHTCELGANLKTESDGKQYLSVPGRALALGALARLAAIIDAWDVKIPAANIFVLGTAALRDARDGPDFVRQVKRLTGLSPIVLDGQCEGALSACGVLSGMPGLYGMVADLGGGSLEVTHVTQPFSPKQLMTSVSLPLGTLRVRAHLSQEGKRKTESWVQLTMADRLGALQKGGKLVCVGGSWRRMAEIYQREKGYPLARLEGFALPQNDLLKFLDWIENCPQSKLKKIAGDRAKVIRAASLVLRHLVATLRPSEIMFSEHGLREGLVHLLQQSVARKAAGCDNPYTHGLVNWLKPLKLKDAFCTNDVIALACRLAEDFDRGLPPKARAQLAIQQVLNLHATSLNHKQIAFLALMAYARHRGDVDGPSLDGFKKMLTKENARRALVMGLAIRLAHTASGNSTKLLRVVKLRVKGGKRRKVALSGPERLHLHEDSKVGELLRALNKTLS